MILGGLTIDNIYYIQKKKSIAMIKKSIDKREM